MNKIAFLFSRLLAFSGVNLFIFCVAVQELLPKIGYLVYQSHSPAYYDEGAYQINLVWLYLLAIACVIVGLIMAKRFYLRETLDGSAV